MEKHKCLQKTVKNILSSMYLIRKIAAVKRSCLLHCKTQAFKVRHL